MPTDPTQPTPAPARKVAFVSLGCPKNLVDSEKMLGLLAEDGVIPTDDHDEADAIVINTCGFLEEAKEESLEVIREAAKRKDRPDKRLVVAGCLVQRHREQMREWCPEIDALIGVFDRDHIVEAVLGPQAPPKRGELFPAGEEAALPNYWVAPNALVAAKARGKDTVGLTIHGQRGTQGLGYFESDASRLRLTPRHYAYLRVSEGCNQNCTFCTIPSIRGKMRSKPLEALLPEARELLADGAFELNLIGQDTTSYGDDTHYAPGLAGMLRELNGLAEEHGGAWLRLMYAYPSCFTDEMIEAIADLPHVVKYIDMPLQHISDPVLTAMRRHTSRALIGELLAKLRERIPGLALRTTFITGFPGETEAQHEELLEFIEDFGFDMLGVFEFSTEPGTPSAKLAADPDLAIAGEVKKRRYGEIMEVQQRLVFEQNEYLASLAGEAEDAPLFDVLIDEIGPADESAPLHIGRCYHQAPQVDSVTYVRSGRALRPGELVRCRVIDVDGYDLVAVPTDDSSQDPR
jgi:ribosomal protein S12 methylthiotransferase